MSNSFRNTFIKELKRITTAGSLSTESEEQFTYFFDSYQKTLADAGKVFTQDLEALFMEQLRAFEYLHLHPFVFEPIHQSVRSPIDFYNLTIELMRPLVDRERSTVGSDEALRSISAAIARKENVILMATHQTETDPQLLSLLLEKEYPELAQEMIFVAGERVVKDPLAVPGSMGRNLICIYSKRHIGQDQHYKREHNTAVMLKIVELLKTGGKCIYVALSGGRDRPNSKGDYEVAPLDPKSMQMFHLLAKRSNTQVHFHPLTLKTYAIFPPPKEVKKTLGEQRDTGYAPIHAYFGNSLDLEALGEDWESRSLYVHKLLSESYKALC